MTRLVRRLARPPVRFVASAILGLVLMGVAGLLRVLRYRGTVRLLATMSPLPTGEPVRDRARRLAQWIGASQWRWYGSRFRCIHRALVIWWTMRWFRVTSEIVSGAAEEPDGGMAIHAWVEASGVLLGDSRATIARYTRLWPELGAATIAGVGRRNRNQKQH